jgi:hypothetical protein
MAHRQIGRTRVNIRKYAHEFSVGVRAIAPYQRLFPMTFCAKGMADVF